MITISTIDTGWFSVNQLTLSTSCIAVEQKIEQGYTKFICPYCNQEITVIETLNVLDECPHIVWKQIDSYSDSCIVTLFFDKKECTIFSFDEIQGFLTFMPKNKIRKNLINKLNSKDFTEAIATEWEVVIMKWLSLFGKLEYEKTNSQGRNPDIYWTGFDKEIAFSADVKTVFDQSDRDYPAYEFCREARTVISKYIPEGYFFDIRFESKTKGIPSIFPKTRFDENLTKLEKQVIVQQEQFKSSDECVFEVEGHKLVIKILESSLYAGMGYRAHYYNELRKNPLFNGLTSKASQLVQDDNELLGIFVCDGHTKLLNPVIKNWDAVFDRKIIPYFFIDAPHIDFVVTYSITSPPHSYFKFHFYKNQFKDHVNDNIDKLQNIFTRNISKMSHHKKTPFEVIQDINFLKAKKDDDIRKYFE